MAGNIENRMLIDSEWDFLQENQIEVHETLLERNARIYMEEERKERKYGKFTGSN